MGFPRLLFFLPLLAVGVSVAPLKAQPQACEGTLSSPSMVRDGNSAIYVEWPTSNLTAFGRVTLGAPAWQYKSVAGATPNLVAEAMSGYVTTENANRTRSIPMPEGLFSVSLSAASSSRELDVLWGQREPDSNHLPLQVTGIRASSFDGKDWSTPLVLDSMAKYMLRGGSSYGARATGTSYFATGGSPSAASGKGAIFVATRRRGQWHSEWVSIGPSASAPAYVTISINREARPLVIFAGQPSSGPEQGWGVYSIEGDPWGLPKLIRKFGGDSSLVLLRSFRSSSGTVHVVWLDTKSSSRATRFTHAWRATIDTTWRTEFVHNMSGNWTGIDVAASATNGIAVLTAGSGRPEVFLLNEREAVRVDLKESEELFTDTQFSIVEWLPSSTELSFGKFSELQVGNGSNLARGPSTWRATLSLVCPHVTK